MTETADNPTVAFEARLRETSFNSSRTTLTTLQVNVGRICNQVCRHCHVDAGPRQVETMDSRTARRILDLLAGSATVRTLDITGGAPELCSQFKLLVREARRMGKEVIDRCNLTILFEPGHEDLAFFLRDQGVHVIASLPCYDSKNVDKQRGSGVFDRSMAALKLLNSLGYGNPNSGLELDLVYNPLGPSLPPAQAALESAYKTHLWDDYGICFNRLFTITNLPIKRFKDDLARAGQLDAYMSLLAQSFNPNAVEGLMCRSLLSVRWDGRLSDCDFNQMLDMPVGWRSRTIWDIESLDTFDGDSIAFAEHCYACSAGAGSSCGGAIVRQDARNQETQEAIQKP